MKKIELSEQPDSNLEPASDEDISEIIDEISQQMIDEIRNMPPTQEEIEYFAAKTDEERTKVFSKYNDTI